MSGGRAIVGSLLRRGAAHVNVVARPSYHLIVPSSRLILSPSAREGILCSMNVTQSCG